MTDLHASPLVNRCLGSGSQLSRFQSIALLIDRMAQVLLRMKMTQLFALLVTDRRFP